MAGFGVFDVRIVAVFDIKILAVCFGATFLGVSSQNRFAISVVGVHFLIWGVFLGDSLWFLSLMFVVLGCSPLKRSIF